jgi:hypothetical protein
MASKQINIFLMSFVFLTIMNISECTVLIKAGNEMTFSCDKNIYYTVIEVIFSEKPQKELYPFTLDLATPDKFSFKCMLDYAKGQLYCFHAFSGEDDYLEKGTYLQFPYPFPELEDIEWDYETFLNKIYRKVWTANSECGDDDIFNKTSPNYEAWKMEGKVSYLQNGKCLMASVTKEDKHKYMFDMNVSFETGDLIELLKKAKDKENEDIELIQEIWVPLLPREEKEKKKKKDKNSSGNFPFAFCSSKDKITKANFANFTLNCYVPIKTNTIFNGVIRINSFFDKVYIRQNNKTSIVSTYFAVNTETKEEEEKSYISLDEKDQGIVCPNQPVFSIDNKDEITIGLYYPDTNKYTFFLSGTLTNGYYVFKNGSTVELNETYKDLTFNLVIEDNLLKDDDENERNVTCLLPIGSPFNIKNEALIKCTGSKESQSNVNKNVDITLNWEMKENNNFKNIIISWPKTYDESYKKNLYSYQLTGLSIRQSNFGCHNNNFDFYVYIYNLYREPKLSFDLPLSLPKDYDALCELFDPTVLKCSLNLKHKKLSKGEKVMLPDRGTENEVITDEGNRIIFTMNNYSKINNDHDFYVVLEESCGDYMVVGTLKDMGMSHNTSVTIYILIIVFICLFILGMILYIGYKIRLKYKRGSKLTTSEETKDTSQTNTTNVKI